MHDPTITLAGIQSHSAVLQCSINRYAANSGRSKVWSGAIVAGMLLLAAGKAQMSALPWAAGVVVLLALADAGQGAMARVFTDAYNRFMRKLPLNGGNAMKAEEFMMPSPELGWRDTGKVLGALASFSVWPFYSALLALLVAFHVQTSQSATQALQSATGKLPSGIGAAQSAPNEKAQPATTVLQPRQALPYSPIKASPMQPGVPGVRYPAVPPARFPQNGVPPQNGAPQIPKAGGTPALQPPQVPGADGSSAAHSAATPAKAPDGPMPEGKPGNP